MKRIVYTNNEGGISIVCPSASWKGTMEELALKVLPEGTPYEIVNTADIPTDREFRNAWEYDKGFKINATKKQVILDKKAEKDLKVIAKQEALDSIDSAKTIAALNVIVKKLIGAIQ